MHVRPDEIHVTSEWIQWDLMRFKTRSKDWSDPSQLWSDPMRSDEFLWDAGENLWIRFTSDATIRSFDIWWDPHQIWCNTQVWSQPMILYRWWDPMRSTSDQISPHDTDQIRIRSKAIVRPLHRPHVRSLHTWSVTPYLGKSWWVTLTLMCDSLSWQTLTWRVTPYWCGSHRIWGGSRHLNLNGSHESCRISSEFQWTCQ